MEGKVSSSIKDDKDGKNGAATKISYANSLKGGTNKQDPSKDVNSNESVTEVESGKIEESSPINEEVNISQQQQQQQQQQQGEDDLQSTGGGSYTNHSRNPSTESWSSTKPKPKAGYTCKICGKQGGEPDSHWFQLCPNGNQQGGGVKNFQAPKKGYICKFCGKAGGEADSHWFQQCPFRTGEYVGPGGMQGIPGYMKGPGGIGHAPPSLVPGGGMMSGHMMPMSPYEYQMMYHPSQLYYIATMQQQMANGNGPPTPGGPGQQTQQQSPTTPNQQQSNQPNHQQQQPVMPHSPSLIPGQMMPHSPASSPVSHPMGYHQLVYGHNTVSNGDSHQQQLIYQQQQQQQSQQQLLQQQYLQQQQQQQQQQQHQQQIPKNSHYGSIQSTVQNTGAP